MKERRFSWRVRVAYGARLTGLDGAGKRWRENAVIDNIGSGGMLIRLPRMVPIETHVTVAARLSTASVDEPALHLAARGIVLRTAPLPDGSCEVAVEFTRRRVF